MASYNLPKKSKQHSYGGYETLVSITICENGIYSICKSAEYSELTGKQISGSVLYDVCDDEDILNSFKTLADAKKLFNELVNG